MLLSIIASFAKNRALGLKNKIPWHLSSDLKRFKAITLGHTIIMGQNTYLSIGHPLSERRNFVLSQDSGFSAPGCRVFSTLDSALDSCSGETEVFIIGGGQLYASVLPKINKMYLTRVDASPEADVFFPEFDLSEWRITSSENFPADEQNDYSTTYSVYKRIKKSSSSGPSHQNRRPRSDRL